MKDYIPWYGSNDEYYEHEEFMEALEASYNEEVDNSLPSLDELEKNPKWYNDLRILVYKGYPLNMQSQFKFDFLDLEEIFIEDEGDFSRIQDKLESHAEQLLGEFSDGFTDNITPEQWEDLYGSLHRLFIELVKTFPHELGIGDVVPNKQFFAPLNEMTTGIFDSWRESTEFGNNRGFIVGKTEELYIPIKQAELLLDIPKEKSYFRMLSNLRGGFKPLELSEKDIEYAIAFLAGK